VEVYVQRIVFGAEIYGFGLSEREVREVLNRVMAREREWDVSEIRKGTNGKIEILLEHNTTGCPIFGGEYYESLKRRAGDLFKLIETELERYATLKPYLAIYNNCNGHNGRNGTREVLEKVGIPVL